MTSFKLADPHPSGAWVRNDIRAHPCRQYWMTENFKLLVQSDEGRNSQRSPTIGREPDAHFSPGQKDFDRLFRVMIHRDDPLAFSLVAPPLRPR